jgi:O-antigen ligase/Flp pilus assembly protein TadD
MLGRGLLSPVGSHARVDIVMLLSGFVTYLLTATTMSHPRWRIALLGTIALMVIGNLVVGFIHFSGSWSFHVVPHFARTFSEGRVGGFFNNANHLAAFLSVSIILVGGIIAFGRASVTWKLLLGFLCFAAAVEVVLTRSRAGMAGLAVAACVFILLSLWLVWRTNRHLFIMVLIGGGVFTLISTGVLYQVAMEPIKQRLAGSPLETDVRLGIWQSGLQQYALSPATGMGSRMFTEYGQTFRSPNTPIYQPDPVFVHNEYLQMLADYGWVGISLLVLVILLHLGNGLRFLDWFIQWRFLETSEVRSDSLGLTVGSLAALIGALVHAAFEFHFHVGAMVIMGSVLAGVLMNPGFSLESHTPLRVPFLRPVSKVALALAGAALLGTTLRWASADYAASGASLAAMRGDTDGELSLLQRALKNDPRNAELYFRRGLARLRNGLNPSTAKGKAMLELIAEDFRTAVELNPWRYLYAVALTDALDAQGRSSEALVSAMMAIRAAPQHEEARLALAMHYTRTGELEAAERAFLWARQSSAQHIGEEASSLDFYREMLRLGRLLAQQK